MYKTIDAVRASSEVHAERLRTLYSMDICTVALPPCACTGTGVPTAAPVETALSLPKRIFLFTLALFFCAVGCTGLSEVPEACSGGKCCFATERTEAAPFRQPPRYASPVKDVITLQGNSVILQFDRYQANSASLS